MIEKNFFAERSSIKIIVFMKLKTAEENHGDIFFKKQKHFNEYHQNIDLRLNSNTSNTFFVYQFHITSGILVSYHLMREYGNISSNLSI